MSDAWFADKISPDGIPADGCDPLEARSLQRYINGSASTSAAVDEITRPTESSADPGGHLPVFWDLITDALLEFPDAQDKMIDLLRALQVRKADLSPDTKRTGPLSSSHPANALWSDLPGFLGWTWDDGVWFCRENDWRRSNQTYATPEAQERVRLAASAEAKFLVSGIGNTALKGYRRLADTLEDPDANMEIELPTIIEWLTVAGRELKEGIQQKGGEKVKLDSNQDICNAIQQGKGVDSEYARTRGTLWHGVGGLSEERWLFWKQRLDELRSDDKLEAKVRELASRAFEAVEAL